EEDCLYLNVFTRNIESCETDLKPIVVFFHGGAFLEGSSSLYGPRFLMTEDIVLVTVNYRLGIFGFASSKDGKVSGNFGLKDQNMALRWIRKNIRKFCGDPENVTIMGQSAGAASVHFHVLSPMSRGLFSKAISMSGFSENLWVRGTRGSFEFVANKMGLLKNTTEETLSILRETSSRSILQSLYTDSLNLPIHEPYLYGVIIDGEFVVDEPMDLIRSGKYNKVPYFFGYTNKEGIIYHVFNILETGKLLVLTDFKEMLPKDLDMDMNEFEDAIKSFYFNSEDPSEKNCENFVDLASDLWFRIGYEDVIKAHAKNGDMLYYYRFSADSKMNTFKRLSNITAAFTGASHEDDVRYLFNSDLTPNIEAGSREDVLIDKVIEFFVNFIKFGKPSDHWPRVTNDQMFFCDIGDNLICGKNPDRDRLDFWNNLYKKQGLKKAL
ncbi:PREDICTED: esterase E4-like, partial [Nicrophorus vespilloides]|uniref:Esterase E4-like n=1 Tax=Nicrophorus vespilloides TaxID=110193 RepID=A0ABM1N567_NICVS